MAWLKRKSLLVNVALACVALLVVDEAILSPFLDWRDMLVQQRDTKVRALNDAKSILAREKNLRELLAGLGASITWDSSAAEGQLLHVMHAWEQSAGLTSASFQRLRTDDEQGFTQLTFQITAVGSMGSAATLLYQVETSPIPLRVEDVEVRPAVDGGGVQVYFKVTTPCKGSAGATSSIHYASVERRDGGAG